MSRTPTRADGIRIEVAAGSCGAAGGRDASFLDRPADPEASMARFRNSLRTQRTSDLEQPEAMLMSLSGALEAKDPHTAGHSARVGEIARRLAAAWGLPAEDQRTVWRAGLLHDIGKVGIPGELLGKPSTLAPEERLLIERHPEISYEICRPLPSLEDVLPLIRGHHECLDGSGYPDGLRGDAIRPALHCLIVADHYDALTTARPYRCAFSRGDAFEILREEVGIGRLLGDAVELLSHVEREAPVVHFS